MKLYFLAHFMLFSFILLKCCYIYAVNHLVTTYIIGLK